MERDREITGWEREKERGKWREREKRGKEEAQSPFTHPLSPS